MAMLVAWDGKIKLDPAAPANNVLYMKYRLTTFRAPLLLSSIPGYVYRVLLLRQ